MSGVAHAERCGWHSAKTSRIELGRQLPSDDDIRCWCIATGAELSMPDLIASARNVRGMYLEWRRIVAGGAANRQRQTTEWEHSSKLLRWFEPWIVIGLLQTRPYAEAILARCLTNLDRAVDVSEAVDVRMERQKVLETGVHRFHFLLAEQAMYTGVGDDMVMADQLSKLAGTIGHPRVALGIVPASAPFTGITHGFSLFDNNRVMVETISAELTVTTPTEILLYEKTYKDLADQAVYGGPAQTLIRKALAGLGD